MTEQTLNVEQLQWDKSSGLIPAIVQHAQSGAVLMLGYMNHDALAATLQRGRVVFFSRSKKRLWEKGESSGHTLEVTAMTPDCDSDALLIRAIPAGPVCHTGTATCFGDGPHSAADALAFIPQLEELIDRRIAEKPEGSYTARLFSSGMRQIAQKVGEEGLEVALAGAGEADPQLLAESADLIYHLLVLLRSRGLRMSQVIEELQHRHASRSR